MVHFGPFYYYFHKGNSFYDKMSERNLSLGRIPMGVFFGSLSYIILRLIWDLVAVARTSSLDATAPRSLYNNEHFLVWLLGVCLN